ncbi:MAG TPA: hypothetical protein VFT84_12495 [Gemmatimonadales bacterium]|nr:hypothetical protein [Gemmatimonadales bacterium]
MTGAAKIDQETPRNTEGEIGDGEVTRLQYGASGSETPNAGIPCGQTKEVGISVGKGKFIVTGGIIEGEKASCSGTVKVTKTSISGEYSCAGLTSYDPASGMGKVDITVRFTATS